MVVLRAPIYPENAGNGLGSRSRAQLSPADGQGLDRAALIAERPATPRHQGRTTPRQSPASTLQAKTADADQPPACPSSWSWTPPPHTTLATASPSADAPTAANPHT